MNGKEIIKGYLTWRRLQMSRERTEIQRMDEDLLIDLYINGEELIYVTGMSPDFIYETVTRLTRVDLMSDSRKREFMYPRQLVQFLLMKYTNLGSTETGKMCGVNHSTVLHNVKTVENFKLDKVWMGTYGYILDYFKNLAK